MGVVLVVGTQDAAALSTSNFQFQAREFHFFPALFSKDE
ncbi:hypothetical protein WN943_026343 [Citrus x changshan-huyou]